MKKRIEKNDLYQLHLLSGLKASPSGNRLVYVHTQMAKASDTYEKSLWLLEGGRISVSIRSSSFPPSCGKMSIHC